MKCWGSSYDNKKNWAWFHVYLTDCHKREICPYDIPSNRLSGKSGSIYRLGGGCSLQQCCCCCRAHPASLMTIIMIHEWCQDYSSAPLFNLRICLRAIELLRMPAEMGRRMRRRRAIPFFRAWFIDYWPMTTQRNISFEKQGRETHLVLIVKMGDWSFAYLSDHLSDRSPSFPINANCALTFINSLAIHGFPRARLKLSRFPLLQTSQNADW